MAKGWEAGGVSGDWGLKQAICLDLINQSHWTIQMKTNGLGCLLWLPHMQQCVGRSSAFWGLQLKNWEFLQTAGQPVHLFHHNSYPDWSIVKLKHSWLINSVSITEKGVFYVLIKLGRNCKKCMKYRIKNSYPNKLICVCIIHSTDICVTQLWWPHCNYDLKKKNSIWKNKQTLLY